MTNYPIKQILWATAVAAIILLALGVMIPLASAVIVVFLGVLGLLMASKWVAKLFTGGSDNSQDEEDYPDFRNRSENAEDTRKMRLVRIGRNKLDIEDGQIVDEKRKD